MTTTATIHFRRIVLSLALGAAASQPRAAAAQLPVTDGANLAARAGEIVTQGLQYIEQVQSATSLVEQVGQLARQIARLDSTYTHLRDAANGRVAPLGSLFTQLAEADASTLLDADFGSWKSRLPGTSQNIANALEAMDGASLSSFLLDDLAAATDVNVGALRGLFPDAPPLGDSMAVQWERGRARGDRIRAADLATAEAAGRVTRLLRAAQVDIDGRKGQSALSHTALQQAQVANQLTAAEMQVAIAQLEAVRVQQAALARHEAELAHRARMALWVAAERAAQQRADAHRAAAERRRAAWRTANVGTLVNP